jgi:hypothetical protein
MSRKSVLAVTANGRVRSQQTRSQGLGVSIEMIQPREIGQVMTANRVRPGAVPPKTSSAAVPPLSTA